jgi:hypothetical protein
MPFGTAMARLKTALEELDTNVRADLRSKSSITAQDRRALRGEIEMSMQRLDELRTLLAG